MISAPFFSSFDNHSVSSQNLFSIIDELSKRRMLGKLDLVAEVPPCGFLLISPYLTAELIKAFSSLPCDENGRRASIVFCRDSLSLCIHDSPFISFNELVHIARISSLAGFDKKHRSESIIKFSATTTSTEEHSLYAISMNKLREIFKKHFPGL